MYDTACGGKHMLVKMSTKSRTEFGYTFQYFWYSRKLQIIKIQVNISRYLYAMVGSFRRGTWASGVQVLGLVLILRYYLYMFLFSCWLWVLSRHNNRPSSWSSESFRSLLWNWVWTDHAANWHEETVEAWVLRSTKCDDILTQRSRQIPSCIVPASSWLH